MASIIVLVLLSSLAVVTRSQHESIPDEDFEINDNFFPKRSDEELYKIDVFGTSYIVIAIVGLLANSVVLFVIFCGNEITKTVTAIYVVQLAIADISFLIVLLMFAMQQINQRWNFGLVACKICQMIKFLNYYAGMFFLTAMSVDRYVAVEYSTRARQIRTVKRTLGVCGIVWLVSIAMSSPVIIYANLESVVDRSICRVMFPGYKSFDTDYFLVEITYQNSSSFEEGIDEDYFLDNMENTTLSPKTCKHKEPWGFIFYEIAKFIIGYFIPLVVIVVSYLLILRKLRQSSETLRTSSNSSHSHSVRQRVTRMVVALVVCFNLCWLPYQVYTILLIPGFSLNGSEIFCFRIENILIVIAYSNSIFNPLLYTFLGHNFRKRLSDSWKKTRNRISYRSIEFGSIHRKSFFHKTTSRKPTGYCAPFSKISPVESGPESTTMDTENPGHRNATKTTLLVEMHTEKQASENQANGQSNQFEKSEFLSRS